MKAMIGKASEVPAGVLEERSMEIIERMRDALGAASDQRLADTLGVSRQAISFARKKRVPFEWVMNVAVKTGRSLDWLVLTDKLKLDKGQVAESSEEGERKGKSDRTALNSEVFVPEEERVDDADAAFVVNDPLLKYGAGTKKVVPLFPPPGLPTNQEFYMVPKVRARLSGGTGSLETGGEIEGYFAFRYDWLHRKGRMNSMLLMEVTGDSMEPIIREKDMVLIDQSQKDIYAGKIYAVGIDDVIVVKRVDSIPGRIVLRSENRVYPPIEIDLSSNDNVRVIGRVIWLGREDI